MLFDGPPSELPIATLRPTVHARRRTLLVDLERWLSHRRAWIRPRAVPLLVALAGLFATLGAVKAIGRWSSREPLALSVHAQITRDAPAPAHRVRACGLSVQDLERARPVQFVIQPLTPSDHYTVLTIGSVDPR